MKFPHFPSFALFLALGAFSLTACDNNDDDNPAPASTAGQLDVEVENVVGNEPLTLDTRSYTNANGDAFTVSKFAYYLSNLKLTTADGIEYAQPDSYYLVSEADAASKRFTVTGIPAGDYTRITFTIGVDSTRNVSGAQTGALNPSNNMFWSWNSGYIFLRLEGNSPQARNNGALVFHIGGFKTPNSAIRTVSPALPTDAKLQVREDRTPEIHLKADVLKMFTGPNPVRFAEFSSTGHGAGSSSVKIADNYAAGMFTVDHIHGGQ